jgi:hypothetical protein
MSWEPTERDATLVVKMPGATPRDFFSDGSADPKPEKTAMADAELRFVYDEAPLPGSRPLRGVIVANVDGKEAFYELEAPLPEDKADEKANEKADEKSRQSKTRAAKKKR